VAVAFLKIVQELLRSSGKRQLLGTTSEAIPDFVHLFTLRFFLKGAKTAAGDRPKRGRGYTVR
jgi:hypothetical protein